MTIFAGIDDRPIMRGQVTIPAYGIWHADIWLDREVALTGQVTLTLADISAVATIVRVIGFLGQTGLRIVGGYGGWRKPVDALQFAAPLGLPLKTVLVRTAADVGEFVEAGGDSVGVAYVRASGPAARVLQSLVPARWYVGWDGVTQASARPAGVVADRFMVMDISQPAGAYVVASNAPGEWLPGRTFRGPSISGVVSRVQHQIENATLRTVILDGG